MKKITDANFEQEVVLYDGPVLIDFWADWCMPCRQVTPILEKLGQEYPQIKFLSANLEDCPTYANAFKIQSVPTVIVMDTGSGEHRFLVGARPKSEYMKAISDVLAKEDMYV